MMLSRRARVTLFILPAIVLLLLAPPAAATPIFRYSVSGAGLWIVDGESTGQVVPISGSATISYDDLDVAWDPAGDHFMRAGAYFDLDFMGYHLIARGSLKADSGREMYLAGMIAMGVTDCMPALPPRWWEIQPPPDKSLAAPCFAGLYTNPSPPWQPPVWLVDGNEGLNPRWVSMVYLGPDPESIPDPGSTLLLLGIGLVGLLVGLRTWRRRRQ